PVLPLRRPRLRIVLRAPRADRAPRRRTGQAARAGIRQPRVLAPAPTRPLNISLGYFMVAPSAGAIRGIDRALPAVFREVRLRVFPSRSRALVSDVSAG